MGTKNGTCGGLSKSIQTFLDPTEPSTHLLLANSHLTPLPTAGKTIVWPGTKHLLGPTSTHSRAMGLVQATNRRGLCVTRSFKRERTRGHYALWTVAFDACAEAEIRGVVFAQTKSSICWAIRS